MKTVASIINVEDVLGTADEACRTHIRTGRGSRGAIPDETFAGDLRTAIVGWLIRDDLLGDSPCTKWQAAEDHPG